MRLVKLLALVMACLQLSANSARAADENLVESLRPKKFVLSIGIGQFANPVWHPLRYARKDAEDIYSYFNNSNRGFDGGELVTDLKNPVSVETLEKSFARLQQDNRSEDDTVVVYVSTHGTVAYKEEGKIGRYIITSQTDPKNMKATALDYDRLISLFQNLRSRKKVLILAFCHSGVGKSVLTPEMKRALAQLKSPYFEEPIQERSEGSIVLTASGWREPALEDERLQNDVYTHFLIEGFGRDRNGDGAVSITEAHAFASQATFEFTQGRQRPSAIMELLGSDPVIVSGAVKKQQKTASLFSLMDRFSRFNVAINGKDFGSVEKGLVVPEGNVRLTIRDPDSQKIVADRVVNFQAGREYSVANYLMPRLPHSILVGMKVLQFISSSVEQGYAPTLAQGLDVRYTYEEALGLNDISLSASFFPEVSEDIEVTLSDGVLRKFAQKRSMWSLSAEGSRRFALPSLSSSDRVLRTEARTSVGLGVLNISRQLDEAAFLQQEKSVNTLGGSLAGGLETTWAYQLLRLGAQARIDLYRNFTESGGSVLLAPNFAVYLGSFW